MLSRSVGGFQFGKFTAKVDFIWTVKSINFYGNQE